MQTILPEDDSDNFFEMRTTQTAALAVLFNILTNTISDVIIVFTVDGMMINTYDTSGSIFISVMLDSSGFDWWFCKDITDSFGRRIAVQVCLNVHNINNVMKSITASDDVIKWGYNPKDEFLKITIISSSRAEERQYKLVVQDGADVCTEIHSIDGYRYKLTMPSMDLSTIFKHLKQLSVDKVKIKYVDMNLIFEAVSKSGILVSIRREGSHGPDNSDIDKLIINKEPTHVSCYCDDFKFDNLYNFTKCAKISGKSGGSTVLLYLSEDEPLAIQFNVGKLGTVIFFLGSNQEDIE